jgi:uncharacterized protein YjbJ (UPF0337 family)
MNQDIISGKWQEIKGKVKQQWGNLTDDEITQMKGNHEELQGLLQKRYGYEKDAAEKQIDSFIKLNGCDK